MSIFVTATGTDVGKTLVCAWLALHTGADYWKPIQCGTAEGGDSATIARLSPKTHIWPERYRFPEPRSPHVAARMAGQDITLDEFRAPPCSSLLIEGAGGLYVPLSAGKTMLDLIVALGFPVLLIAHGSLGTINHTLLSLEALRRHDIAVAGVVLTGDVLPENPVAIEDFGHVRVLAQLPFLEKIDTQALVQEKIPDLLTAVLKETLA